MEAKARALLVRTRVEVKVPGFGAAWVVHNVAERDKGGRVIADLPVQFRPVPAEYVALQVYGCHLLHPLLLGA